MLQFTFHATMIRDGVTDLYQASSVDIINKVGVDTANLYNIVLTTLPNLKLIESLDVPTFKEIGMKINDLVYEIGNVLRN